jgi:hypothetical protein
MLWVGIAAVIALAGYLGVILYGIAAERRETTLLAISAGDLAALDVEVVRGSQKMVFPRVAGKEIVVCDLGAAGRGPVELSWLPEGRTARLSVTLGHSDEAGQPIVVKQAVLDADGAELREAPLSQALR